MSAEYTQGLGKFLGGIFGDFSLRDLGRSLLKGLATTIAGGLGGPFGAVLSPVLWKGIDQIWPPAPGGLGRPVTDEQKQKALENWIDRSFKPWFVNKTKSLKGSEDSTYFVSSAYREKLNAVIKDLEAVRVYYQIQEGFLGGGVAGRFTVDTNVNTDEAKTKEAVVALFLEGLKTSYKKALDDLGYIVKVQVLDFNAKNHETTYPTNFNFDPTKDFKSQLEIFKEVVKKGTQNNSGNSFTTSNPTKINGTVKTVGNTKQDFTTPPINPSTPTTMTTETNQNQNSDEEVPVNQTINNTPTTTTSNTESKKNNYLIPTLGLGTIIALLAFGNKKKK
ncbi:hypothetical protein LX95_01293 [Mesonia algae]|uniref:Uncharacterized protein n=1 Tax=Mesonia algae TaxID=213248 RepID=A0A2W7I7Y9_9FLAO|nr:hypothetical protein [Mesonia algae]PZW41612.1 hypothetical protein LX95_01293 [Mesonia algae]